MNKNIFDTEIDICKKSYKEKGGCNWGKCNECGVILLLQKLHNGQLIEDKNEVKKFKQSILDN